MNGYSPFVARPAVPTLCTRFFEPYLRYAIHYLRTLERIEEKFRCTTTALEEFDLEWPNIEKAQRWAAENAESDVKAAGICCGFPNAGASLIDLRLHPQIRLRWRESALKAAQKLGRRDAEAVHVGALGTAAADLGDQRTAVQYQKQRILLARELEDRRGEANGLSNLAQAYTDLGKTRRTLPLNLRALSIFRELGDRQRESAVLCNIGNAYYASRQLREAADAYQEALSIDRALQDVRAESRDLNNLGLVYADLGETADAIDCIQQALEIDRKISDVRSEGIDTGNLGYCTLSVDEVVQLHNRHIEIASVTGDAKGEAIALWNKSLTVYELGETREAIQIAGSAVALFESIAHPMARVARDQLRAWCESAKGTETPS